MVSVDSFEHVLCPAILENETQDYGNTSTNRFYVCTLYDQCGKALLAEIS